jgi:hypothetical protein
MTLIIQIGNQDPRYGSWARKWMKIIFQGCGSGFTWIRILFRIHPFMLIRILFLYPYLCPDRGIVSIRINNPGLTNSNLCFRFSTTLPEPGMTPPFPMSRRSTRFVPQWTGKIDKLQNDKCNLCNVSAPVMSDLLLPVHVPHVVYQ